MKNLTSLLILILVTGNLVAQVVKKDTTNLAIFIVDYQYGYYEGGTIIYDSCESCNNDSLPLSVDYYFNSDFQGVRFHLPAHKLVFEASIKFDVNGEISYPNSWMNDSSFACTTETINFPDSSRISYFDTYGIMTPDEEHEKYAQYAISQVLTTNIMREYDSLNYRLGVFSYDPDLFSIGPPGKKWIIFAYAHVPADPIPIDYTKLNFLLYPNPARTTINLLNGEKFERYRIVNMLGNVLKEGEINEAQSINVETLLPGTYRMQLFDELWEHMTSRDFLKKE